MKFLVLALVAGVCASAHPSAEWRQQALDSHNDYRALHGTDPIVLDDTLNTYAQDYAEKLAAEDAFEHSGGPYGENLFASWGLEESDVPGSMAVDDWYSEIKSYTDYANPDLDNFGDFGHFTQVLWKDTTKMGIGMATSATGMVVVVGSYDPPGNYFTVQEFVDNVAPLE